MWEESKAEVAEEEVVIVFAQDDVTLRKASCIEV